MLLSSIFKSPKEKQKEKYAKSFYGAMASKDSPSGNYTSYKRPLKKFTDDIQMGLGYKPKDPDYYARTAVTKATALSIGKSEYGYKDKYGNITNPALSPEAIAARQRARRGPTAAELKAQRKAAELAERKRLGQIARKKFEKEGGEKTAKKKALLLNIT